MLYRILAFPARLAIHFYCKKLIIHNRQVLKIKGPVILAANHPNSFLDAILMATIFRRPVYSLARGDAFVSSFVRRIFHSLKMLPVYRISEGKENLKNNYDTFRDVRHLLEENKMVLIFSEGLCINEWRLRPLKKGTARIAFDAWEHHLPAQVIPVGINYSGFRRFGKNIHINFGSVIGRGDFTDSHIGHDVLKFNDMLHRSMSDLVYEVPGGDLEKRKAIFEPHQNISARRCLLLPAVIGYGLNGPFYLCAHLAIRNIAKGHYDSIMVGLMFLFYPWYVLLITLLIYYNCGWMWSAGLLMAMPVTALAVLHYRDTVV